MASRLGERGSTWGWRRVREWVLERDGWLCRVPVDSTGRPMDGGHPHLVRLVQHPQGVKCPGRPVCDPDRHATVDHVVDRVDGGGDTAANLRAACARCNGRRAAARTNAARRVVTPHDWLGE